MAQLIVAAAGAAIGGALLPGFAFLGITGAGLGWAVGSAIGASFGPSIKQQGPRLNDLKVTGTEYGQPIPYVQGHPRDAGQLWWSSDKREIATTTETGKGGPSVETTTYTYEVDLLIGLTDNPIQGVARVWSNGKLVWTKRSDSGAASALSGKSQTSWRRLTVYPGAADQLPDPTYEAAVGVGSAPAYRGRGTVFIEGLQLGGSGQIPNLTFEVYTEGDEEGRSATTLGTFPYTLGQRGGIPAMVSPSFTHHILNTVSGDWEVYRFSLGLEEVELVNTYTPAISGSNPSWANSDVSGSFLMNIGSTTCTWYDDEGAATTFTLPYGMNTGSLRVVFCRSGDNVLMGDTSLTSSTDRIYRWPLGGGVATVTGAVLPGPALSITVSGDDVYVLEAKGTGDPTAVWRLDLATLSLQATLGVPSDIDKDAQLITDELGNVYCYNGAAAVYRLDGGSTWTQVKTITGGIEYGQAGSRFSFYGGDLWCITLPGGGADAQLRVVFDSVTLAEPTVQTVVDNLLARTGIASGSVDTTDLATITTPVRALAVSQVAPVRSVLEQLGAAYFFECFLADKLYFVPRGGSSAATVAYADLGATDAGQAVSDPLPIDSTPDEEIPAQVALTYANADADYNTATEHSDRLLSNLTTTSTVQLPLAFEAAEAKGVADAMVQDTYAARLSGQALLDVRHMARTPTDVITLTDDDGSTYRVRIVRRTQQGMRLECEWVSDDATALASAGVTSDDYTPSLSVSLPGPTTLALMDIPILRDADNAPGIYAAAKPVGTTNWPGARLMGSTGGDYSEAGTFTSRAIFGTTTVALTNWAGGNVFDESGSVTVDVGAGTLSSATRDAMLDSDANAMMVGAEIIQFRTATLVTTGVYKLTGLLRGRRGTEHAMTGHTVGETCVLLRTTGLLRLTYDAARIGVAATFRAVTLGKTLDSATARSITDTGVALKPYAPQNLRLSTSSTQSTLTWDRRSRLSYRWPATSSLPLGEEAESYDFELRDGSSGLVQSATVSVPQVVLSGATEVDRLGVGVTLATTYSGTVFGMSIEGSTYADKRLIGQDAATGVTTSQLTIGDQVYHAIVVGSDYYVSAITVNDLATPAVTLTNRVYRVDLTAPTAIAAQRDATAVGDYGYMAHDGTVLWVTEPASGNLRALNASTLVATGTVHAVGGAPLGIAHSGGDLYYFDSDTDELVKFNIAGASETWRVSAGTSYATSVRVVGSLVFIAGNEVAVHATSDGALAYTHDFAPSGLSQFLDYDGDVLAFVFSSAEGYRALQLSATTGEQLNAYPVGNGTQLALIDGDVIYVNEVQGDFTDYDAVGYELVPSLTGYTATVWQVSATVGRGYPASITF